MASEWIEHVKKYAKENGIKYGEALSKAGATFKKSTSPTGVAEVSSPIIIKSKKSRKSRGSKKTRGSKKRTGTRRR
jgi:hypothetical protein